MLFLRGGGIVGEEMLCGSIGILRYPPLNYFVRLMPDCRTRYQTVDPNARFDVRKRALDPKLNDPWQSQGVYHWIIKIGLVSLDNPADFHQMRISHDSFEVQAPRRRLLFPELPRIPQRRCTLRCPTRSHMRRSFTSPPRSLLPKVDEMRGSISLRVHFY